MYFLPGDSYHDACTRLKADGWTWLADGDWSRAFASPDGSRVVRVTPFDPAYRLWAKTCRANPHPNLPRVFSIVPLAGWGYAVEMPRYTPGDEEQSASFLAGLKARVDSDANDILTVTVRRAVQVGRDTIPYFGGLDDNPANVLYDGATPVLVDGFFQAGARIVEGAAAGASRLTDAELAAFFQIPYHERERKARLA